MNERKETLSSHNDMCQRFEGYRSQYSDKASDASGCEQNTVKGVVEQNTVKSAQL